MTKNSKSTATIRRRKNKPVPELLSRVRKSQAPREAGPVTPEDENEYQFFHKEVLGSSVIAKIMASDKTIFLGLVVIRMVNAMLIQTSFVPDEFWQSVEVAHKMVFDYGYLTWEWRLGIRSYAYPLVLATLYKLLYVLGIDHRLLMIRGPRLLQGVLGSVCDMYLYLLSGRLAGRQVARWSLLCQLLSWFTAYCCTRTLTNSVEATLVTAALFYFPWPGYTQFKGHTRRFVLLAAVAVVVRPTAAVLWLLLCSWHLQHSKGPALWSALKIYLTAGSLVLSISTLIDRVWYGRWVLVHLNFLHFNVLSGGSAIYGRHPWHWYLTQGLPLILGPHLLPFVLGAWHAKRKVLLFLLLWKVFVLSFLPHKEFRFLLPVLPLAMHYCGVFFHSVSHTPTTTQSELVGREVDEACSDSGHAEHDVGNVGTEEGNETAADPQADHSTCSGSEDVSTGSNKTTDMENVHSSKEMEEANAGSKTDSDSGSKVNRDPSDQPDCGLSDARPSGSTDHNDSATPAVEQAQEAQSGSLPIMGSLQGEKKGNGSRAWRVRLLVVLLAGSNLVPMLYFCLIHQRGTIDVMNYLHHSHHRSPDAHMDVLYLMPCHSTPYYSFLHVNISMTFLTCEPNLEHQRNYTDVADKFYHDPARWLKEQYVDGAPPLPTHIIYFNCLGPSIAQFLQQAGYRQCAQFFHTHFPEGRVGSHVLVSCR